MQYSRQASGLWVPEAPSIITPRKSIARARASRGHGFSRGLRGYGRGRRGVSSSASTGSGVTLDAFSNWMAGGLGTSTTAVSDNGLFNARSYTAGPPPRYYAEVVNASAYGTWSAAIAALRALKTTWETYTGPGTESGDTQYNTNLLTEPGVGQSQVSRFSFILNATDGGDMGSVHQLQMGAGSISWAWQIKHPGVPSSGKFAPGFYWRGWTGTNFALIDGLDMGVQYDLIRRVTRTGTDEFTLTSIEVRDRSNSIVADASSFLESSTGIGSGPGTIADLLPNAIARDDAQDLVGLMLGSNDPHPDFDANTGDYGLYIGPWAVAIDNDPPPCPPGGYS